MLSGNGPVKCFRGTGLRTQAKTAFGIGKVDDQVGLGVFLIEPVEYRPEIGAAAAMQFRRQLQGFPDGIAPRTALGELVVAGMQGHLGAHLGLQGIDLGQKLA